MAADDDRYEAVGRRAEKAGGLIPARAIPFPPALMAPSAAGMEMEIAASYAAVGGETSFSDVAKSGVGLADGAAPDAVWPVAVNSFAADTGGLAAACRTQIAEISVADRVGADQPPPAVDAALAVLWLLAKRPRPVSSPAKAAFAGRGRPTGVVWRDRLPADRLTASARAALAWQQAVGRLVARRVAKACDVAA